VGFIEHPAATAAPTQSAKNRGVEGMNCIGESPVTQISVTVLSHSASFISIGRSPCGQSQVDNQEVTIKLRS
jgi:hypothetical protein